MRESYCERFKNGKKNQKMKAMDKNSGGFNQETTAV